MWHAERAHVGYGFEIEAKNASRPLVKQVHGDKIVTLEIPADFEREPVEADGVLTTLSAHPVYVFTADCIPLLFYAWEPVHKVAAVHCGWRGAAAGIASKAVDTLLTARASIHVFVGPSIGPCCFEVKEDFLRAFDEKERDIRPYVETRGGKMYCRLLDFVKDTDLKGVSVDQSHWKCTVCSLPPLPSYRRNKDTDPRIRSWIAFT